MSRRQTLAGPIVTCIGGWPVDEERTALPKSPFGQAVSYAWNRWPTLGRCLPDNRFEINYNAAERAGGTLALDRKNWLLVEGGGGLRTVAVLMSLCAAPKRQALNPWMYLTDVLTLMAAQLALKQAGFLYPFTGSDSRDLRLDF
ncbi:Mobile element protein [Fimbriiglobus ruber]|uniref:Mobile element protein n=1 Tax=Fimbriiglobus ruber TaxID=1908690 RepID=A0A225D2C7_9BACT|nr:Mobile element protein [Fimbriiglobus ruber]